MRRLITGFHQDDLGDWVAELSCLHGSMSVTGRHLDAGASRWLPPEVAHSLHPVGPVRVEIDFFTRVAHGLEPD